MSEKEARVLAAGDTIDVPVEIVENGERKKVVKTFHLKPVGMQQLHEVQRAAVKSYKREYLSTYAENLDLLPKDQADKVIERKLEEVARWDVGNLPVKMSYDVRLVPIESARLITLLEDVYGDLPENEATRRAVLAASLDAGLVTIDDVEKFTGARPGRARIPYDSWWVTAVRDGMIEFVWSSVKMSHPDLSRADVGAWPVTSIMQAARMVERLTAPALGNT